MAPKRAAEKPREWKIVKFNGVTLRRADLEILNGPYFFNDRIVDFYLTYLDARMYSDTLLILPPSIALWIKHTPVENESLKFFIELLHLPRRNIILCPVINEDKKVKSSREGGRHWSLLVFVKSKNAFMHFDSSKGNMNRSDAEQVYKVLRPYVSEPDAVTYIEYPKTPKQEKPCDCGVYILAFARIICDWYNKHGPRNNITDQKLWFPGFEVIKPPFISYMRGRITVIFENILNRKVPRVDTKNYKEASMTLCKVLIADMEKEILQDDVVLTYNRVAVRLDDYDSLATPFFITDRTIEFYFSYLSSSINSDEILLVPPSIMFWLKDCPHDKESHNNFPDPLLPLNPSQKKIIIFPLINEDKKTIADIRGNHWSLLAFERSSNVFVHHDSSAEHLNMTNAECMYQVVRPYVSKSTSSSESDATTYVEYPNTPVQQYFGDCGVYVLAIARAICTWYTSRSGSSGSGSSSSAAKNTDEEFWFLDVEGITQSLISSLRHDVQKLIENLAKKQK